MSELLIGQYAALAEPIKDDTVLAEFDGIPSEDMDMVWNLSFPRPRRDSRGARFSSPTAFSKRSAPYPRDCQAHRRTVWRRDPPRDRFERKPGPREQLQ
jgi:hypothetical protein